MYPEMLEHAKEDGNKKAEISFNFANQVEKIHHKLYNDALAAAEKNEDLPKKKWLFVLFVDLLLNMKVKSQKIAQSVVPKRKLLF